jgi:hypothetical protein
MPAAVGQQLSTIQAQPPHQQTTTQVDAAAASEEFAAACQYTEQSRAAGLPVQLTASTEQHVETAQQLGAAQQVVPAAVSKQLQEVGAYSRLRAFAYPLGVENRILVCLEIGH